MDDRRELNHVGRVYDRFVRGMGEEVTWWELDVTNSHYNSTYDESPDRIYHSPVRVTAVQVDEVEPQEFAGADGRHPVQSIRAGFTAQALREVGISFVHGNAKQHLNDVLYYNGRYYEISNFQLRGRIRGDVVVGVTGLETVQFEETVFDTSPPTVPLSEPPVI
jgi:hypothetical protein